MLLVMDSAMLNSICLLLITVFTGVCALRGRL